MYIPNHFKVIDDELIINFIQQIGFGILVTSTESYPLSTHLPILLEKQDDGLMIKTHMAAANPHAKFLTHGTKSLLIIAGEHAYISPKHYEHEDVPTWDYTAAHCYVEILIPDKPTAKLDLINLVKNFEGTAIDAINPENFSPEMMKAYENHVFSFHMKVIKTEAAFKLSQNRTAVEKENIRSFLKSQNNNLWEKI